MHFDFPTILVLATFLTGGIWLVDALAFAPRRRRLAAASATPTAGTTVGAKAPGVTSGETASRETASGERASAYREPLLVEYARAFFPVILIVLLLRSFVVEPFRIPSGSMMPTLLVGDFILVNKFSYGLRLPVIHTRVADLGEPARGDVAVFRFPQQETIDYIKRIVGVPGDQLFYRDKTLYVNGEPQARIPLGRYQGEGAGSGQSGLREGMENLTGVKHQVLYNPDTRDFPYGCTVFAQGPITVPPGHYFAMGDNRDNSNDSRCWGLVPERNLVGKAFVIWMHWDRERDGFPIDFRRIGEKIQ